MELHWPTNIALSPLDSSLHIVDDSQVLDIPDFLYSGQDEIIKDKCKEPFLRYMNDTPYLKVHLSQEFVSGRK